MTCNKSKRLQVLINLCSANLLSAVIVKSISIVHNAYAVAANSSKSNIAFCILYVFGWRLTWAVLPWSILALSWLSLLPPARRLQVKEIKYKLADCPRYATGQSDVASRRDRH